MHQRNQLSCSDCHNPMAKFSGEGRSRGHRSTTPAQCHRDVLVQFHRRSHMPLPEGQMSCVDCHNPHGSITSPLLKTNTVNETCYQCHAEKRGPFLFEHSSRCARTGLNCHTPARSQPACPAGHPAAVPVPAMPQQPAPSQRLADAAIPDHWRASGRAPDRSRLHHLSRQYPRFQRAFRTALPRIGKEKQVLN